MNFVSRSKNTLLLLYVTICEIVVPRLNKHDDVIEWNFMKIVPPKWRAGCAPNEVRWRPGQETSLAARCSNLRSFGSKSAVEESTCDIVLGLLAPPALIRRTHNDWAPGELRLLVDPRYASEYIAVSGVTKGVDGLSRPPGKLNVKTGLPLVDILIFSILQVAVFCVFRVFFLSCMDIHDFQRFTIIS